MNRSFAGLAFGICSLLLLPNQLLFAQTDSLYKEAGQNLAAQSMFAPNPTGGTLADLIAQVIGATSMPEDDGPRFPLKRKWSFDVDVEGEKRLKEGNESLLSESRGEEYKLDDNNDSIFSGREVDLGLAVEQDDSIFSDREVDLGLAVEQDDSIFSDREVDLGLAVEQDDSIFSDREVDLGLTVEQDDSIFSDREVDLGLTVEQDDSIFSDREVDLGLTVEQDDSIFSDREVDLGLTVEQNDSIFSDRKIDVKSSDNNVYSLTPTEQWKQRVESEEFKVPQKNSVQAGLLPEQRQALELQIQFQAGRWQAAAEQADSSLLATLIGDLNAVTEALRVSQVLGEDHTLRFEVYQNLNSMMHYDKGKSVIRIDQAAFEDSRKTFPRRLEIIKEILREAFQDVGKSESDITDLKFRVWSEYLRNETIKQLGVSDLSEDLLEQEMRQDPAKFLQKEHELWQKLAADWQGLYAGESPYLASTINLPDDLLLDFLPQDPQTAEAYSLSKARLQIQEFLAEYRFAMTETEQELLEAFIQGSAAYPFQAIELVTVRLMAQRALGGGYLLVEPDGQWSVETRGQEYLKQGGLASVSIDLKSSDLPDIFENFLNAHAAIATAA